MPRPSPTSPRNASPAPQQPPRAGRGRRALTPAELEVLLPDGDEPHPEPRDFGLDGLALDGLDDPLGVGPSGW